MSEKILEDISSVGESIQLEYWSSGGDGYRELLLKSMAQADSSEFALALELAEVISVFPKIIDELRSGDLDVDKYLKILDDNMRDAAGSVKESIEHLKENFQLIRQISSSASLSMRVVFLAVNISQQALDSPENKIEKIVKHNVKPAISIVGATGPLLAATISGAAVLGPVGIGISGLSGVATGAASLGVNSRNIDKVKSFHLYRMEVLDAAIRSYEGFSDFSIDKYEKIKKKDIDKILKLAQEEDRAAVKNLLLQRNAVIDKTLRDISEFTEKRIESVGTSIQEVSTSVAMALTVASMGGLITGGVGAVFAGPAGWAIIGAFAVDYALTAVPEVDKLLYELASSLKEKMDRKDKPWYSPVKILSSIGFGLLTGVRGILAPVRFIAAMYNNPIGIFSSVWNAHNMPPWKKAVLLPFAATAAAVGLVANVGLRLPVRAIKSVFGAVGASCFSLWSLARAGVDKVLHKTGVKKVDESGQRLLAIKDAWKGLGKSIKKDLWDRFADPIRKIKKPKKAFIYDSDKPETGFLKFASDSFKHKTVAPDSVLRPKMNMHNESNHSLVDLHMYIEQREQRILQELEKDAARDDTKTYAKKVVAAKKDDKKLQLAYAILASSSDIEGDSSAKLAGNRLLQMHQLEHNDLGLSAEEKGKKNPGMFSKMGSSIKNFFGKKDDTRYGIYSSWFGESRLKTIFLDRKAELFTRNGEVVRKEVLGVLGYKIRAYRHKYKGKKISAFDDTDYYKYRALCKVRKDLLDYKRGKVSSQDIKRKIKIIEKLMTRESVQSSTLATSETVTILDYARQFWLIEQNKLRNKRALARYPKDEKHPLETSLPKVKTRRKFVKMMAQWQNIVEQVSSTIPKIPKEHTKQISKILKRATDFTTVADELESYAKSIDKDKIAIKKLAKLMKKLSFFIPRDRCQSTLEKFTKLLQTKEGVAIKKHGPRRDLHKS